MNYELKPREQVNARGITIEDSYWEFARKLGRGNASRGIRIALYEASISRSEGTICESDTKNNNEVRAL